MLRKLLGYKMMAKMTNTCKDCAHFIGAGDWDLCCTEHHDGYPFGFLCYEDTPACKKFEEKASEDDVSH
jgi:hypothetical protein